MNIYKQSFITLVVALLGVGAIYAGLEIRDRKFGSGEGSVAKACTTSTVSPVQVSTTASNALATSSRRAYAKIELIKTATDIATITPRISFSNGAKATAATGFQLSTTTPLIEFGLNTDHPYTGTVSIISPLGASILRVTECNYIN